MESSQIFKYGNVAYYSRKTLDWLCKWQYFRSTHSALPVNQLFLALQRPVFPSSPFSPVDLKQWRAPFLLSHPSRGVLLSLHPHGRRLCVFLSSFWPLLSSFVHALLLVLYACNSFAPPLLLYLFYEPHLPSSERDMSRVSFCEHTKTPLYTQGGPGSLFFFHFSVTPRAEWSVNVRFLAELHGIHFQACCFWKWHCWWFMNTTHILWDEMEGQLR